MTWIIPPSDAVQPIAELIKRLCSVVLRRCRYTREALRRHRVQQVEERLAAGVVWQELDPVFCTAQGHPLDGRNLIRRAFAAVLMRAGLPRVRFHDLRHTAATAVMSSGVPNKVASEVLGHANPGITTRIYQHVTPGMRAYAAKAMDTYLQDLQEGEGSQATE